MMYKPSKRFTRKIVGVYAQAEVSHTELVIQVRDDQAYWLCEIVSQHLHI